MNKELFDYVHSNLEKRVPEEHIRKALLDTGWKPELVEEAISSAKPKPKTSYNSTIIVSAIILILGIGVSVYFLYFFEDSHFSKASSSSQDNSNQQINKQNQENIQEESANTELVVISQEEPISNKAVENISLNPEPENLSGPLRFIECGEDMNCFVEASKTCRESKVLFDFSVDFFGMLINTKYFYEIRGVEEGKCVVYTEIMNYYVDFSEEMKQTFLQEGGTEEEIQLQLAESNAQSSSLIGIDSLCKFHTNEDLYNLMNNFYLGNFEGGSSCSLGEENFECESYSDWDVADCEGVFYD